MRGRLRLPERFRAPVLGVVVAMLSLILRGDSGCSGGSVGSSLPAQPAPLTHPNHYYCSVTCANEFGATKTPVIDMCALNGNNLNLVPANADNSNFLATSESDCINRVAPATELALDDVDQECGWSCGADTLNPGFVIVATPATPACNQPCGNNVCDPDYCGLGICELSCANGAFGDPPLLTVFATSKTPLNLSATLSLTLNGQSFSTTAHGFGLVFGLPCASPVCLLQMGMTLFVDDFTIGDELLSGLQFSSGGWQDFQVVMANNLLFVFPSTATFVLGGFDNGQPIYAQSQPDVSIAGDFDPSSRDLTLFGNIPLEDSSGNSIGTLSVTVTGTITEYPPTAVVVSPITVNATSPSGAPVHLDASGSYEQDNAISQYIWYSGPFSNAFIGKGATLEVTAPIGTTTYTVTVVDLHNEVSIGIVVVNVLPVPPIAVTQAAISAACSAPGGATVTLDGSKSHGIDAPLTQYVWRRYSPLPVLEVGSSPIVQTFAPLGSSAFSLTVVDSFDLTATADTMVTVVEEPPIATAGPNQTVECTSHQGSLVQLDGSGSSDPFGRPLTYEWSVDGGLQTANGIAPSVQLGFGPHEVTLTVTDPCGTSSSSATTIAVQDTRPPDLTVGTTVACLWPPNHKFEDLSLGGQLQFQVSSVCDPNPAVAIVDVTSNEDATATGSGNTSPDEVFNSTDACIRAERAGSGEGRTYAITVEAKDFASNRTDTVVSILVPHDQSGHPTCAPAGGTTSPSKACLPAGPARSTTVDFGTVPSPASVMASPTRTTSEARGCNALGEDESLALLAVSSLLVARGAHRNRSRRVRHSLGETSRWRT